MNGYVEEKLKVLQQLGINLTKEMRQHLIELKTEIAIDNCARKIIMGN